jgi:hypothetical protein
MCNKPVFERRSKEIQQMSSEMSHGSEEGHHLHNNGMKEAILYLFVDDNQERVQYDVARCHVLQWGDYCFASAFFMEMRE